MSIFQLVMLALLGLNLVAMVVMVRAAISLKLDVQRLADKLELLGTSLFPLVVRNILPEEWEMIRQVERLAKEIPPEKKTRPEVPRGVVE